MKSVFVSLLTLTSYLCLSQSNLIPNGDFESTPTLTSCRNLAPNAVSTFNSDVNIWKIALHTNGSSNSNDMGQISLVNTALCTNLNFNTHGCGSFPNISNSGANGLNFAMIRANYTICTSLNVKNKHGAIGVALNNGSVFDNNKTYVVRYKIIPLSSLNHDNTGGTYCSHDNNGGLLCHIRFFLSENTPPTWNANNSDQQELYSVSYQELLSASGNPAYTSCAWKQVERVFTCNQSNYTSLILYAESGGAAIDDVEVFEQCETPYYIQNKIYTSVFEPGAIGGNNMGERSGDILEAGQNVTSGKTQGNVQVWHANQVNFTAPNKISLKPGFRAMDGSTFRATLLSCPNSLNRNSQSMTNKNPDPNYVPSLPMERDIDDSQNAKASNTQSQISFSRIFPNPSEGIITYETKEINPNSNFVISNILNQVFPIKLIGRNATEANFDISSLTEGIYLLNHYDPDGRLVSTNKLIKQ